MRVLQDRLGLAQVFPPRTRAGLEALLARIDRLAALDPLFIDVTWTVPTDGKLRARAYVCMCARAAGRWALWIVHSALPPCATAGHRRRRAGASAAEHPSIRVAGYIARFSGATPVLHITCTGMRR